MPTLEQAHAWYVDGDPVHDFYHIERVYRLAERLAQAEKADIEIVRASALLHDAAGSSPGGKERPDHHLLSADFAAQILSAEGWTVERIAAVQHCIRGHRFRSREDQPQTIEAKVMFDADKLDVLGAIGVARTIAYAALNNQPIFAEPSAHFLQTGKTLPGEPHSSYHEYLFKLSKVKSRLFTRSALKIAEERAAYMDGFYAQLAAETRGER